MQYNPNPYYGYGVPPQPAMYFDNPYGNMPMMYPQHPQYPMHPIPSAQSPTPSPYSTPALKKKPLSAPKVSAPKVSAAVPIKNQWKFDVDDFNKEDAKAVGFPMYFGCDRAEAAEFSQRRRNKILATPEPALGCPDDEPEAEVFLTPESSVKHTTPDIAGAGVPEVTGEESPASTATAATAATTTTSAATAGAASRKPMSWSAMAASKVPAPAAPKKTYSAPSGLEPLGLVLLRCVFDPQYVPHVASKKGDFKAKGIVNTGNLCFMSSILQCLFSTQPFVDFLRVVDLKASTNIVSQTPVLDATVELLKKFSSADKSEKIVPDSFYKVLSKVDKFKNLRWGHQEDAEEFCTHLLDALHEELHQAMVGVSEGELNKMLGNMDEYQRAQFKAAMGKKSDDGWNEVTKGKKTASVTQTELEPTPVSHIFSGQFKSVLSTPGQAKDSISYDPFQTLQLDTNNVGTLQEAVKQYTETEKIMMTSNGQEVECSKQTFFHKLPNVLLIQLKRFQYVNNTKKSNLDNYNVMHGRVEKILKQIPYSMTEEIGGVQYQLHGVVYHHGLSSDGGHYTADVLVDSQWMRIDDDSLDQVQAADVLASKEENKTAYILFYQRA